MAKCQFMENCPFFNAEEITGLHNLTTFFKEMFCLDDFSHCSRYKIATTLGREYVPRLMTPEQGQWADQIITDYRQNHENMQDESQ